MTPGSFACTGMVHHRRQWPAEHRFSYPVGWLLLDLDRARDQVQRGWWCGWRKPALTRFHRPDFLRAPGDDVAEAARVLVQQRTGMHLTGGVSLLTTLRMAGLSFNPVSFYFCRDDAGAVRAIIAEITNTPWGQRHAYVLPCDGTDQPQRFRFAKQFHVSPFHPMEQTYDWRFAIGPRRIAIAMSNHQVVDGVDRVVFDAALHLDLVPLSPAVLVRHCLRWPVCAARALIAIHRQALTLWWKRTPFFSHPEHHLPRSA
jgi:uncharacterized protein